MDNENVYYIEQFPKNKNDSSRDLSEDQKKIRNNAKKYYYGEEITCNKCHKAQHIQEFYITNKNTGRRKKSCRDCQMKEAEVVEIGKSRFSKKILDKGFRRCSVCKEIKPLTEYAYAKTKFGGHTSNCKKCNAYAVSKLQIKGREDITDWYVREYGKRNYNLTIFDTVIIKKLREEIIEKRKPKYFIDSQEFLTVAEFARYIEDKYGLPVTTTEKRISEGKTLEQCKLSERQMRSIAYTKGKIKVTDTVTNDVFEFENTRDKGLLKMFSSCAISKGIKTGIISSRKYKNPCIIIRIFSTSN